MAAGFHLLDGEGISVAIMSRTTLALVQVSCRGRGSPSLSPSVGEAACG